MSDNGILLADDSFFMRAIIKRSLQKYGFSVIGEASNGIQAVEKFRELNPGLLVMDVNMPGQGGLQALREIKKEFPEAKVIMCTSIGQKPYVMEAVQSGAFDFVVKPVDEHRLIEAVRNAFGMI